MMKAFKIEWHADEEPGVVFAETISQAAEQALKFVEQGSVFANATGGARSIEEIGLAIGKAAK